MRQFEQVYARLHAWLRTDAHVWSVPIFQRLLAEFLQSLHPQYAQVLSLCLPAAEATGKKGKKGKKGAGSRTHETHRELCGRIETMFRDLEGAVDTSATCLGRMADALEDALRTAFTTIALTPPEQSSGSQRGSQTIVVPYQNSGEYGTWVQDRKRVKQEVVATLGRVIPVHGHAPECPCHTRYLMKGCRRTPRKCRMVGGQQEHFPIRMVACADCGQRFSLLPSFLAREKHVALEIIGHVVENWRAAPG